MPTHSSSHSASRADSLPVPEGFDLQGHRGARGLAPENTLPAFRRALELGVTTLEMDVVISGDGDVVVSHEPWMSHEICTQPSGVPVPADEAREHNLYRMSYAEIERYDCGQRRHPDFPEQQTEPAVKPRLREVIQMADGYVTEHDRAPVFFNIEVKSKPDWEGRFHPPSRPFARHVLEVVSEAGVADRATIQSFDGRVLRALRAERSAQSEGGVGIGLLVGLGDGSLSEELAPLEFVPDVYGPHYLFVESTLVEEAHDRGMRVVPWTVNDPNDMRRLIRLGVDGLITDYPNVAQEVLAAEGSSP